MYNRSSTTVVRSAQETRSHNKNEYLEQGRLPPPAEYDNQHPTTSIEPLLENNKNISLLSRPAPPPLPTSEAAG